MSVPPETQRKNSHFLYLFALYRLLRDELMSTEGQQSLLSISKEKVFLTNFSSHFVAGHLIAALIKNLMYILSFELCSISFCINSLQYDHSKSHWSRSEGVLFFISSFLICHESLCSLEYLRMFLLATIWPRFVLGILKDIMPTARSW